VALSLPTNIVQIMMDPMCTSDTEEGNQGVLRRMHLPWRSQELTNFCQELDQATVDRLRKEKGAQYFQRTKLLELRRQPAINTSKTYSVPAGLPPNCYNPLYLESKPKIAQDVLKAHIKSIEFPSI